MNPEKVIIDRTGIFSSAPEEVQAAAYEYLMEQTGRASIIITKYEESRRRWHATCNGKKIFADEVPDEDPDSSLYEMDVYHDTHGTDVGFYDRMYREEANDPWSE